MSHPTYMFGGANGSDAIDFDKIIDDIFYEESSSDHEESEPGREHVHELDLEENDQAGNNLMRDIEVFLDSVKRHKYVVFPLQYCPHSDRAVRILEQKYGKLARDAAQNTPTSVWQSYLVPIKHKERVRKFLDRLLVESSKRNSGTSKNYNYTFPAVFADGRYIGGADDLEHLMRGVK